MCLTANGTFKEPIWAMVLHRSPELLEKGCVTSVIDFCICVLDYNDMLHSKHLQNCFSVTK